MENTEIKTENVTVENEIKKEKKKWPWWKKTLVISGSSLGTVIALVLVLILALNIGKFGIYHNYYTIREVICTNHGMNDNYVSQGTAVTNDGKYVFTSGYMSDKTHSRVYITDVETDQSKYVRFEKDGKPIKYHMGGMAVSEVNDMLFLASNDTIFTLSYTDVLNAENGAIFDIGEGMPVNNQASFVFTDDEYIYVGEFQDGSTYVTNNIVHYEGVTHYAIVEVYDLETKDLIKIYSIRDKVQGFAVSPAGGILLSTSFGFASSHFYYYKASSIVDTKSIVNGVPLYWLGTEDIKITAPAMSEDLDYRNDMFYTNFESSCNKYFLGKLFVGSNYIVGLKVESLL